MFYLNKIFVLYDIDSNPIMCTTSVHLLKWHLFCGLLNKSIILKDNEFNVLKRYAYIKNQLQINDYVEFANGRIRVFDNHENNYNHSEIYILYKNETPVLFTTNIVDFGDKIVEYIKRGEATFMPSVYEDPEEQAKLFRVAFALEDANDISERLSGLSLDYVPNGRKYTRKVDL